MCKYPVLYGILSLAGAKPSSGLMGLILQNSKSSLVVSVKASLTRMTTELLSVRVLCWPENMIATINDMNLEISQELEELDMIASQHFCFQLRWSR